MCLELRVRARPQTYFFLDFYRHVFLKWFIDRGKKTAVTMAMSLILFIFPFPRWELDRWKVNAWITQRRWNRLLASALLTGNGESKEEAAPANPVTSPATDKQNANVSTDLLQTSVFVFFVHFFLPFSYFNCSLVR